MATIHTDLPAVVLDSRDHGESDKIITLFCKDIGKLTAIAKGAHRSKKRFVNKLELFSFLHITYSRSSPASLALINDGDLLNSFMAIRSSVRHYQAATVVREFTLLATNEQFPDNDLFTLLLWTLHSLDKGADCRSTIAIFLIKFYDSIGYRPDSTTPESSGIGSHPMSSTNHESTTSSPCSVRVVPADRGATNSTNSSRWQTT